MKTHNLTQIRAQNDLINCRIHVFSFRDFENKNFLRYDFFWFLRSIFDFLHSSDSEMSQEALEIKRFSDCGVYAVRFAQKSKNTLTSRRTF